MFLEHVTIIFCFAIIIESRVNELTYGRPNWFDRVKEEHLACREKVALFDMSAFAKLEIEVAHGHHTITTYIVHLSSSSLLP